MKLPIDVFSDWANDGRDERMADGHANSVKAMLDVALKGQTNPFTFIDAGCGNGWVVRMMGQHSLCESAIGVDGSESMIEKARVIDSKNTYHCNDLLDWIPKEKVDLVHSMEVFYYMEDPIGLIKSVAKYWLNPGGRLILGIDYYSENKISESWNEDCGISIMTHMSESEWIDGFRQAGLMNIQSWRQGEKEGWAGTLVVSGVN
ncbi:MAG: class I SAM-dependent methyltransferase [Fidelibacterota bacterium]